MKKAFFPIKNELKGPLVSLLDEVVYLHQAFYSKKEDQIHLISSKMTNQIEILEQSPHFLSYHQQSYTHKLLRDIKAQLEAIKSAGNTRKSSINSINRTLTYMAHLYGLKKYAVFFCPKDRSVWMQGKNKQKTRPLHLEYQSCGDIVGN